MLLTQLLLMRRLAMARCLALLMLLNNEKLLVRSQASSASTRRVSECSGHSAASDPRPPRQRLQRLRRYDRSS